MICVKARQEACAKGCARVYESVSVSRFFWGGVYVYYRRRRRIYSFLCFNHTTESSLCLERRSEREREGEGGGEIERCQVCGV